MGTVHAELLTDGLTFGEGPRWHDGRLWLSDFYAHRVHSVGEAGDLRTEVEIDDQPSGLGWLPDGRLLVVSMTKRQVLRREHDGTIVVHGDLSEVAAYHCNDMHVDDEGRAYVGNFGFDLEGLFHERANGLRTIERRNASLARVDPDGSVSVAADDLAFPNGTVVTADRSTMIVAETFGRRLTAFTIGAGGSLTDRREWAPLPGRAPDGIAIDANDHVWVADASGTTCVLVDEGGDVLHTVEAPEPCFACALGGADGRTLFVLTAPSSLASELHGRTRASIRVARVEVPGQGFA